MASDAIPVGRPGDTADPSPQRARVGLAPLFFGLLGGAAAWIAQLIGNYALTSPRCYPHGVAAPAGLWGGLLAINLVALLVALGAAMVAWRIWGDTQAEQPGRSAHVLEAGEGRTRFLALFGILTDLGFAGAIVFDTVVLLAVPLCAN